LRKFFRVLIFNAISILGVAGLSEAIFGTWAGDSFGALNITRETIYFDAGAFYKGGGKVTYARDKFGLRGRYQRASAIDILTIGGSTTDQRYLTEGKTWQDVLAAAFAGGGQTISVVNAGIDGQSSLGHLFNFERWFPLIPNLRARYVLVYVGINDVYVHQKDTSDQLIAGDAILRVHHAIKNNSAVYKVYKMVKGAVLARRVKLTGDIVDFGGVEWSDKPNLGASPASKDKAQQYRARLDKLVRRIRDFGATPILVTQQRGDVRLDGAGKLWGISAASGQNNGLDEARALAAINRETMAACAALKLLCFDLASELAWARRTTTTGFTPTPKARAKSGCICMRR
jgi:lysophospholipase L1-like esterase